MIEPIRPHEVKKESIPDAVIEVFNALISEKWDGREAVIKQKDAVARIVDRMQIIEDLVFDRKYLDVEPIYRDAGWTVEYDKPGWSENYEPSFTFRRM